MARRRVKKATKQPASSPASNAQCDIDANRPQEEAAFIDDEVERQCAAVRALRDVEIERLRTALCLLRSNFSKEQLQTPLQEFIRENLPNLALIKNEKAGPCELKWKDKDVDYRNMGVGGNAIPSFLMMYPGCLGERPSLGGFEFSRESVVTRLMDADNQITDFLLEGVPDNGILTTEDSLQTPGASSQRLSVGMTPKSVRLPKQGEMLLSVHGSPLGVYKENSMDAIHETEEE